MGQEDRSHLWFRSTLESEISRWSTQLQAVADLNNNFFNNRVADNCHKDVKRPGADHGGIGTQGRRPRASL